MSGHSRWAYLSTVLAALALLALTVPPLFHAADWPWLVAALALGALLAALVAALDGAAAFTRDIGEGAHADRRPDRRGRPPDPPAPSAPGSTEIAPKDLEG